MKPELSERQFFFGEHKKGSSETANDVSISQHFMGIKLNAESWEEMKEILTFLLKNVEEKLGK